MDPKHIIRALAIAYLKEHGGKILVTGRTLRDYYHEGGIQVLQHADKLETFSIHLSPEPQTHAPISRRNVH